MFLAVISYLENNRIIIFALIFSYKKFSWIGSGAIKELFRRSPFLGMRLVILIIFSCVLMTLDHQITYFNHMRSGLSWVVAPMQYFVDRPINLLRWVETSFTAQQNLLIENAQLRARQLLLYAKLQKVVALEHENDQLRALLKSSMNIHDKVTVAQLLLWILPLIHNRLSLIRGGEMVSM